MADIRTIRKWDYIWEKLTQLATGVANSVESPFGSPAPSIDTTTTLYVDAAGNDNSSGTLDKPFLTIQAAVDYVNRFKLNAFVEISVGVGTFPAFSVGRLNTTNLGSLTISGTLSTTSISGSATAAASGVLSSITDGTKSWVVDEHVGKMVRYSIDSGVTWNTYPIGSNTATALVIPASVSGAVIYEIFTHGTVITGNMPVFGTVYANGSDVTGVTAGDTNILIYGTSDGQAQNTQFTLRRIKATSTTAAVPLTIRGTNTCTISQCHFSRSANAANVVTCGGSGQITVSRNYFGGFSTSTVWSQVTAGVWTGVAFSGCVLATGATGMLVSSGALGLSGMIFRDLTTAGFSIASPAMCNLIQNAQFTNCATGIIASRVPMGIATCSFATGTTAVNAGAKANITWTSTGTTITNHTNGLVATTGASIQIPASATFTTVTNELSVDGTASTVAAMRALTPKVFPGTPNQYGSYVYE